MDLSADSLRNGNDDNGVDDDSKGKKNSGGSTGCRNVLS
jgi:hypothetical protein